MSASGSSICQVCNDKHSAVYRCDICDEFMCETVAQFHLNSKLTKNHHLILLEVTPDSQVRAKLLSQLNELAPLVTCNLHQEDFRFYDEDCKQLLCRDCAIVTHHGHRCCFIKDAAINHYSYLESQIQETKYQSNSIKQAAVNISNIKVKLLEDCSRVHLEIDKLFDEVSVN